MHTTPHTITHLLLPYQSMFSVQTSTTVVPTAQLGEAQETKNHIEKRIAMLVVGEQNMSKPLSQLCSSIPLLPPSNSTSENLIPVPQNLKCQQFCYQSPRSGSNTSLSYSLSCCDREAPLRNHGESPLRRQESPFRNSLDKAIQKVTAGYAMDLKACLISSVDSALHSPYTRARRHQEYACVGTSVLDSGASSADMTPPTRTLRSAESGPDEHRATSSTRGMKHKDHTRKSQLVCG